MTADPQPYDVVVVGAGHAGCEAALAAARMGCSVLLLAIDLDKVAAMPCSPSIGGMAKGQLVKEVDALGGEMARITDQTAIQYKTLNTKKGPAVHSSRTQNDKQRYHIAMKRVIEQQPNIELRQAMVERLIVEDHRVVGVADATGCGYPAAAVVLDSYVQTSPTSSNPSLSVSPPMKVGLKSSPVSPGVPASSVTVTFAKGTLPVRVVTT